MKLLLRPDVAVQTLVLEPPHTLSRQQSLCLSQIYSEHVIVTVRACMRKFKYVTGEHEMRGCVLARESETV